MPIQWLKEWDMLNLSIFKVVGCYILVWPHSLLPACVLVGDRGGEPSGCVSEEISAMGRAGVIILRFTDGHDTGASGIGHFCSKGTCFTAVAMAVALLPLPG